MCQIGNLSLDCAEEKWLVIPYLPNYHASCWGNIRSAKTGRVKAQFKNWNGYYRINVYTAHRVQKNYRVNRLVACTWLYDDGKEMDVNHKNLNRGDNRAANLEYLTHAENCNYEPTIEALQAYSRIN